MVFQLARRYPDALAALKEVAMLHLGSMESEEIRVNVLLASNQMEQVINRCESPDTPLEEDVRHRYLALAYKALGRQADAERESSKVRLGDSDPYDDAAFLALWGDTAAALSSLAKAEHLRDGSLQWLRVDYSFRAAEEERRLARRLAAVAQHAAWRRREAHNFYKVWCSVQIVKNQQCTRMPPGQSREFRRD